MREESHLDDMRTAIRGDFERLAKRRGGQELMRDPVHAEDPEERPASAPPVAEPPVEQSVEPIATGAVEAEPPDEEPAEEAAPTEKPERQSFLDRLLGR